MTEQELADVIWNIKEIIRIRIIPLITNIFVNHKFKGA